MASLETLINFVSLKSRRPCFMALETLKESFASTGGGLIPGDRRLKKFRDQPFQKLHEVSQGKNDKRDRIILLWIFEHKLKEAFAKFLSVNIVLFVFT